MTRQAWLEVFAFTAGVSLGFACSTLAWAYAEPLGMWLGVRP